MGCWVGSHASFPLFCDALCANDGDDGDDSDGDDDEYTNLCLRFLLFRFIYSSLSISLLLALLHSLTVPSQ